MKKIFCFFVLLMFTLFFAGCVANTGIVKISDDTYMIAKQEVTAWSGSTIKIKLYQKANDFCEKMGKKFVQVSHTSNDYGFQLAGAEIQFKCQ